MSGKLLKIDLDPVPKFLKLLVDGWAPRAMIVSFKLETDPALLKDKCAYALKKYAHHLVIGNMLNTRKFEVLFVSAGGGEKWIRVPQTTRRQQKSVSSSVAGVQEEKEKEGEVVEIESLIIPEVKALHTHLIEKGDPRRLSQGSDGRPVL